MSISLDAGADTGLIEHFRYVRRRDRTEGFVSPFGAIDAPFLEEAPIEHDLEGFQRALDASLNGADLLDWRGRLRGRTALEVRAVGAGRRLPDGSYVWDGVFMPDRGNPLEPTELTDLFSEVVDQNPFGVMITDRQGHIEYVNPRFTEMTGYEPVECLGRTPTLLRSERTTDAVLHELWTTINAGHMWRGELVNRRKNGEIYWERNLIVPMRDSHAHIRHFVALKEDISEKRLVRQWEQTRRLTLEMLSGGATLPQVLDGITRSVESENPGSLCSVLLLDESGQHLLHGAAPSLPDFYNQAVHGLPIGPGVGCCGTAAYSGEQVIVEDILHHPYWVPYMDLAVRAGLRSGWSEPIRGSDGKVLGTFAIYHREPIAPTREELALIHSGAHLAGLAIEHHRTQQQVTKLAAVVEQSPTMIVIANRQRQIEYVNPRLLELTGYTAEELLGQPVDSLILDPSDDTLETRCKQIQEGGLWEGELALRHKAESSAPAIASLAGIHDPAGGFSHYIGLFSDISRHKQAEDLIHRLAYFDALTGLPNRRLLTERCAQALAMSGQTGGELALMLLDLDHFKTINESLGHGAGDRLLCSIAARLQMMLRDCDTLGRLGGDEFVLMLPSESRIGAARLAQRMLEEISAPLQMGEQMLTLTASIGVSMCPADGRDFNELLKQAESAMYQAKSDGRNTLHFFTPSMNAAATARLEVESALRQALSRGELSLHYQPQYHAATGALTGMEALMRWKHPQWGNVSPARFIPVAEDCGIIHTLGEFALREACRQAKVWQEAGLPPVVMSVNVSARQFAQGDIEQVVLQTLRDVKLDARWLELEITESVFTQDVEQTQAVLHGLHECGVRTAVDDFGTGYSSLAYLKRLPLHRLKIDQSFVRDLATEPRDRAIASTIVALGHNLGLEVIAEGVETEAQLAVVRELGCDQVQGFLLGRPQPPDQIALLLADYQRVMP